MSTLEPCMSPEIARAAMPPVVYVLSLTCFMLGMSEFMVAGMMPALAQAFDASIAEVGNLISLYAAGMVVGGPILTVLLLRLGVSNKAVLLALLVVYIAGSLVAAFTSSYPVMAAARVLTGVAASACFGVSISIATGLVSHDRKGRASSLVLAGLMLATVVGVPAATVIEQHLGWRASFWAVIVLAALCMTLIAALAPNDRDRPGTAASLTGEVKAFRDGRLWAAYATSAFIIGATFAAFSYFSPIFIEVTGFAPTAVPVVLAVYGVANVVGNLVIGRYADHHFMPILAGGLAVLSLALLVFALFAGNATVAIAGSVLVGLFGLPLNPAMVARVMHVVQAGPLVNTVHVSIINVGLAFGAWAGGLGISLGFGLTSPLWIGFALALLGLLSLAPAGVRRFT